MAKSTRLALQQDMDRDGGDTGELIVKILRWRLLAFTVLKEKVCPGQATECEKEQLQTFDGTQLHMDQIQVTPPIEHSMHLLKSKLGQHAKMLRLPSDGRWHVFRDDKRHETLNSSRLYL